jgi:hypothetical protein
MSTAVFAGVARNCEPFLPRVLAALERLATQYDRVAFVFASSDSCDNTLAVLRKWLTGKQGVALDLGNLERRFPKRTHRIAVARDACLDTIRVGPWGAHTELVMCDLDEVLTAPLDSAGFAAARSWLHDREHRAAAFPAADPAYYDIWALRHPTWCPYDCWHAVWGRDPSDLFMAARIREVHARQLVIHASTPPIPVRSAFGGIGLYKMAHLGTRQYSDAILVSQPDAWEECEHVGFNLALVNDGHELAIVPKLRVRAPREHLFQYEGSAIKWHLRMQRMETAAARNAPRMLGLSCDRAMSS